jgi:perosamine synthetase
MSADDRLPFLPFSRPAIGEEEIESVVETLRSGWLTMGPKTRAFEEAFASTVGAKFAISVSSCTAGLHLGFDALGIIPGDEVLVPTITFTSTAATVIHVGARPRLVDCEKDTLNLDIEDARRKCNSRTKAIIPVHLAGHPCAMDEIQDLASQRGLHVVEDAAHALPAKYKGKWIGTLSPVTVFSFYATKNLTTGEGGMVTTDDENLASKMRSRRLHGMTQDSWRRYTAEGSWAYDVSYPGFKYNMTDVAAAIGLVQLRRLPELQARRTALARRYAEALSGVEEIDLPPCRDEVEHSWHLYIVRIRTDRIVATRDRIIQDLKVAGIGTSVHFIPLHEHSYYRNTLGCREEEFPNASAEWKRMLSLPLFPTMGFDDVDRVAETLAGVVKGYRR